MKKKTGSTAMFMTYGNYLKKFPKGLKDTNAKAGEYGYCIINNADKTNICWLTVASFNQINNGFKMLAAMERKTRKRSGKDTKKA